LTGESEGEGKGATFTLTLPLDGAASVGPPKEQGPRSRRVRRKLRVVLVEDKADAASILAAWLESLGHEVKVAHNGPDGVALILDAKPHVVLCDIGLPEMDGVEVCQRVLRHAATPPVMVAVTGWGMDADRARTVEAGFRHHLVKPVEPEKLQIVLESIEAT
jgi:CheY-like chemotaxis protein